MKHVIIVNGKPGSGKTTFERYCRYHLNDTECAQCHIISSIDPIKELYRKLGWDGTKTEKARKELSLLKKMWIENCNGPIKYITNYVLKLDNKEDHAIFVDIREEAEIIALSEILKALELLDVRCTTLLITRSECDSLEYGNKSDDMVGSNMSIYSDIINNDGDIEDLRDMAKEFINILFNINIYEEGDY